MPWWKRESSSSPSSPKSSSSSPRRGGWVRDTAAAAQLWRHQRRLTRQHKLRHLTDGEVGVVAAAASSGENEAKLGPNSTPISRTVSSFDAAGPARSSSSPVLLQPQPLPLPDHPAAVAQRVPLPAPREVLGRSSQFEEDHLTTVITTAEPIDERLSSASVIGSRVVHPVALRSPEHADAPSKGSKFSQYRKAFQDSNSVEVNFRLNLPAKSAPTTVFSSPARSPRRSNVEYRYTYDTSQALHAWSTPTISSNEIMTSYTPLASPEKILASPERSPHYSPTRRSPLTRSRNPSGPPSPLHPKMFPDSSTAWHEGSVNVSVHPLPLPPGASSPSQSALAHQSRSDVLSMANQWTKGRLIGSGTFGKVYLATNRHTGASCAMKEVDIIPDDPKSAESLKQLEQEIKLLSQLKHQNIVQYYGSEMTKEHFYIYLEYVHPGSIQKYVREHFGVMTESIVRNFTRHILNGLAYLHSKKTVHRDIKGANLLVNADGVVKLADFGMAKHLNGAKDAQSLKGTPHWMAPEVLQATMNKEVGYDLSVDIWSLGCTIIEMFTGRHPWSELEGAAAMFRVLHKDPEIPEKLSREGKDFLRKCFRRDPAERPTASMLLEHHFITNTEHYTLHGSIQAFAGIKLSDNTYSPRERHTTKSESGLKGKLANDSEVTHSHPETLEPGVVRLSRFNHDAVSTTSSSPHLTQLSTTPNVSPISGSHGLHLANGAHHLANGIHHPHALPKP